MTSTKETGHAKNAANFEELINIITGLGTTYNPSKTSIKVAVVNTLLVNVKASLAAVNTALANYKTAVDAREAAFLPISKLATRIVSALVATDTTQQMDETAQTYERKMQGRRATPKLTKEEKQKVIDSGKTVNEVSASQMGYDNRLDNFDKLIKLLIATPLYAPNEADLKVSALNTLYADLKTKNQAVVAAHTALTNARIARNDLMYKPLTGMVDLAQDIKTYIKSLAGPFSQQYKQVSGLHFTYAI